MMHRMKAALAFLKTTEAWYPHGEEQPVVSAASNTAYEHTDNMTRVTTILERVLSSGKIHMIAKNIVAYLQDIQSNSQQSTSIPVAASTNISRDFEILRFCQRDLRSRHEVPLTWFTPMQRMPSGICSSCIFSIW